MSAILLAKAGLKRWYLASKVSRHVRMGLLAHAATHLASLLLRRWHAAAKRRIGGLDLAKTAFAHARTMDAVRCLMRWWRLSKRQHGAMRRVRKALSSFVRRLELRVWRGWRRAVVHAHELRRREHKGLRKRVGLMFYQWWEVLEVRDETLRMHAKASKHLAKGSSHAGHWRYGVSR